MLHPIKSFHFSHLLSLLFLSRSTSSRVPFPLAVILPFPPLYRHKFCFCFGDHHKMVAMDQVTKPKMVAMDQVTKPKMVAMKATKPMSELLKEAWKAKAKNEALKVKRSLRAAKKVSSLAPSKMVILSFKDWQTKSLEAAKIEVVQMIQSPTSTLADIEYITAPHK